MKYVLFIFLNLSSLSLFSQTDTAALKRLYDRVLNFDESKVDSMAYYAHFIEEKSKKLQFPEGRILSRRLEGIHAEYSGEYETAIGYYLECLEISRELINEAYELSALGDLAILYATIRNSHKALEYNTQAMELAMKRGQVSSMVTQLSNMGAVYNQLRQPDSALYYLEKALQIADTSKAKLDLSSLNNNLGNAWFHKKQWEKALNYFRINYAANILDQDQNMLWYDVLNLSDTHLEMGQFDSALYYLDQSLLLAKKLSSRSKEADVNQLYSKFYARKKDFQKAYNYFQHWYEIDTSLVNADTRETIAEMQERFNVKQQEQENRLLESEVSRQKLQKRNITIGAAASVLLAFGTGFFFVLIRKKNKKLEERNRLIERQNEKLSELNQEKNSLISVVSHDLSSPFTSIKMWSQVLRQSTKELPEEQQKAISRIQQSAENGERMIRNILDIEKAEMHLGKLELDPLDISGLVKEIVNSFGPQASQKNIRLHFESGGDKIFLLTDEQRIRRVAENLISNAIKFTQPGKNVYVSVVENQGKINLQVKDEGVGIEKTEMKLLYSKYTQLSSKPTGNEPSTGLGLAIIKRILEELGGQISCESEPGMGTCFTVSLKQ